MDTGITNQLSGIIAQFEKLDAVVRRVNAANKNMADVVRGMNNVGAGMGGIAAASEKMAKAASDIGRVMPDVTRQAEATAGAMERAATAGRALVVYQSSSTQGTLSGGSYTPYGYTPNGRPISLPPPMLALPAPAGPNFTMGPGGPAMPYSPGAGVPAPYQSWGNYAGGPMPAPPGGLVQAGGQGFGGGGMPPLNYGGGLPAPLFGGGNLLHTMYSIDMGIRMVERFMELLGSALDKAVEINTKLTTMHLGGVSEADRKLLTENAYDIAPQVRGRTIPQILSDSISMRLIMGDEVGPDKSAGVRALMPYAEKAAVLLKAATGEDSPEALARLYKTVELRGDVIDPKTHEISPERFKAGLDAALDLLLIGHGQIKVNDLLNTVKQGGPAMRLIEDPYAAWAAVVTPETELGGARTGTGLTAALRQLLGGSMARHFADEMTDLGMVKPGALYKQLFPAAGRNGAVVYGKDFLNDEDVLMKQGLQAWLADIAKKNLAAKGITDAPAINKELYRLMSTETFRRLASIYLTQDAQVARDMLLYKNVPGFDAKFDIVKNESAENASAGLSAAALNYVGSKAKSFLPAWMGFQHFLTGVFEANTDGGSHGLGGPPSLFHIPFSRPDGGYPWEHASAVPIDSHTPINLTGSVNLDGKKIGDFTARSIGAQGELPSAGPTGGDLRISIPQPGFVPGYP
jgi:hypothetical protein